ncbi:MmyB family transcriptional regulator [Gluconobacter kondonii]|uniref:MmyB family transcriptional regulator n=2 Tax=Gluconobacter kondonii TaxID=941463 RepID=UPI0031FF0931
MFSVLLGCANGEGTKRLKHPTVGLIELEYSGFAVDGRPDLGLIIYNPAPPNDLERVCKLIANFSQKTVCPPPF